MVGRHLVVVQWQMAMEAEVKSSTGCDIIIPMAQGGMLNKADSDGFRHCFHITHPSSIIKFSIIFTSRLTLIFIICFSCVHPAFSPYHCFPTLAEIRAGQRSLCYYGLVGVQWSTAPTSETIIKRWRRRPLLIQCLLSYNSRYIPSPRKPRTFIPSKYTRYTV